MDLNIKYFQMEVSVLSGYNQSASSLSVCTQVGLPCWTVSTRGSTSAAGRQAVLLVKRRNCFWTTLQKYQHKKDEEFNDTPQCIEIANDIVILVTKQVIRNCFRCEFLKVN